MKHLRLPILATALLLLAACGNQDATAPTIAPAPDPRHRLQVMTTFYPTTYFTKRIGGGHVDVTCPLPKDADGAFWEPAPEQIAQYQQADLIVLNGANFEHWTLSATLPESKVVVCAEPFQKDWIIIKNAITHSHGPGGKHSHQGINGHTWPDPINAIAEENAIRDALIARDGAHKDDYTANAKALENDLLTLDADFKALQVQGELFASHPSYAYLARRYGWTLTHFGFEPGEPPSEAQVAELKQAVIAHPTAKIMLWEDTPCAESQALMKELGLKTVVFNPGENRDEKDGDYLALMRANLARLKAAVE